MKSGKIREQGVMDSLDKDLAEEFDDVFDADDTSFYNMCQRMARNCSLGRDELCG